MFPGFRRGIVVVNNINNATQSPLENDIEELALKIKSTVGLTDPRITAWQKVFDTFGIRTHDFRPSVEALVRRIHNDKPLGSINPIVDIGTVVCLSNILPSGAHPILDDTKEVRLCIAGGNEVEPSDGVHPEEHISAGEPILMDNDRVATRRWVWRQTNQSKISNLTTGFYLNIDALEVITDEEHKNSIDLANRFIKQVFGKEGFVITLSSNNPVQTVEV